MNNGQKKKKKKNIYIYVYIKINSFLFGKLINKRIYNFIFYINIKKNYNYN